MKKYMIALYIRLSLEDAKTDSMSISSQRSILREYASELPEYANAELMEFVDEMEFDRLGVFTYSMEEDTPAVQRGKLRTPCGAGIT